MTNTTLAVAVSLVLSTNWTGWKRFSPEGDLELGIVETNHMAKVTYEGKDYEFKLKSVPGGIAVWRTNQISWGGLENWTNIIWIPDTNFFQTTSNYIKTQKQ